MKNKKSLKTLILLGITSVTSATFITVSVLNNDEFNTVASDKIVGSLVYSRESCEHIVRSNDYYYTTGTTALGNKIYLRNASNLTCGSKYVAIMCGSGDKGEVSPLITFTTGNSSKEEEMFQFQYITSISAKIEGDTVRSMTVSKSIDGINWSSAGTLDVNSSGGSNTDVEGARYIKLEYSGFYSAYFTEFTVNYGCSDSGSYDPDEGKTVTGISVKTAPNRTEYEEGDYFDPTGLVITATYDDESSRDITYSLKPDEFSFTPSLTTALQTSDENVVISYKGSNCNQAITVSEAGTVTTDNYYYKEGSTYWFNIYIASNSTGYFISTYKAYGLDPVDTTIHFTWAKAGSVFTFTKDAKTGDGENTSMPGFYRCLFGGDNTTNTGTLNGDVLTITLRNRDGDASSTSYDFVLQAE